jgi:hypothetical protein
MSDERTGPVDLAFIGRALQRLRTNVAAMRDEMRVQTAMILRQEATLNAVLEQLRAMVAQHQRTADRVRALEDKIEDAPVR